MGRPLIYMQVSESILPWPQIDFQLTRRLGLLRTREKTMV